MNLLVLVPVIWQQTADDCLRTMLMDDSSSGFTADDVLVVDNTRIGGYSWPGVRVHRDPDGHNLGVAGSWNVGAREVLERNLDWLVIISTSLVFGPELHTTFRGEIEAHPDAQIVEAMGSSWHAIALSRWILEKVGLFDVNFWPAYVEADDWGYRQKVLGYEALGWPRIWFNALNLGHAVHIDKTRYDAPTCPGPPLRDYYEAKWLGPKLGETTVHPFGDPSKPLNWFEETSIPILAKRYGIPDGEWW